MTKYEALQMAINNKLEIGRYLMERYPEDYEGFYRNHINEEISKIRSRMSSMSIEEANEILNEF